MKDFCVPDPMAPFFFTSDRFPKGNRHVWPFYVKIP